MATGRENRNHTLEKKELVQIYELKPYIFGDVETWTRVGQKPGPEVPTGGRLPRGPKWKQPKCPWKVLGEVNCGHRPPGGVLQGNGNECGTASPSSRRRTYKRGMDAGKREHKMSPSKPGGRRDGNHAAPGCSHKWEMVPKIQEAHVPAVGRTAPPGGRAGVVTGPGTRSRGFWTWLAVMWVFGL